VKTFPLEGICTKWKLGKMIPTDRDREMPSVGFGGASFNDVAIRYGLSRERVRQIFGSVSE